MVETIVDPRKQALVPGERLSVAWVDGDCYRRVSLESVLFGCLTVRTSTHWGNSASISLLLA
jgi:hypothetical protein